MRKVAMKPAGTGFLLFLMCASTILLAQDAVLKGQVFDPRGNALANVSVTLLRQGQVISQVKSGPDGRFSLAAASAGKFVINVDAPGFRSVARPVTVSPTVNAEITISVSQIASQSENIT